MQGYNPSTRQADSAPTYTYLSEVGAPASVDWRNSGAVTGVKNQGSCGSCWSFSTTGSIEGINKIKTGTLVSLSEQQFVDCDRSYGDLGCSGGLPENAFQYAKANKIETEAAYPYTGVRATCAYVASKGQVQLKGQGAVTKNSPSQLLAAVATQPVSVGIEADKLVFQSYSSGIITSTGCGISMDHAVLVVGYGSEGGQDYWLLKNSWGVTWGEKGYFRLARSTATGAGICGLQQDATYPTL